MCYDNCPSNTYPERSRTCINQETGGIIASSIVIPIVFAALIFTKLKFINVKALPYIQIFTLTLVVFASVIVCIVQPYIANKALLAFFIIFLIAKAGYIGAILFLKKFKEIEKWLYFFDLGFVILILVNSGKVGWRFGVVPVIVLVSCLCTLIYQTFLVLVFFRTQKSSSGETSDEKLRNDTNQTGPDEDL